MEGSPHDHSVGRQKSHQQYKDSTEYQQKMCDVTHPVIHFLHHFVEQFRSCKYPAPFNYGWRIAVSLAAGMPLMSLD
jgi:hypothetical protein